MDQVQRSAAQFARRACVGGEPRPCDRAGTGPGGPGGRADREVEPLPDRLSIRRRAQNARQRSRLHHAGEELGHEYATLLDVLSEAREELRATGRSSEDPDWQSALDSGMLEAIRAGRVDEAKEILRACLWS